MSFDFLHKLQGPTEESREVSGFHSQLVTKNHRAKLRCESAKSEKLRNSSLGNFVGSQRSLQNFGYSVPASCRKFSSARKLIVLSRLHINFRANSTFISMQTSGFCPRPKIICRRTCIRHGGRNQRPGERVIRQTFIIEAVSLFIVSPGLCKHAFCMFLCHISKNDTNHLFRH